MPAGTAAGSVCSQPVNLLSLFPTLTELCGLPSKPENDGPSIVPLLKDAQGSDWPHVSLTFGAKPGSFGLSVKDWRYIRYIDGGEELYNIAADPYEWTNLASEAEHADKFEALRERAPTAFAPK